MISRFTNMNNVKRASHQKETGVNSYSTTATTACNPFPSLDLFSLGSGVVGGAVAAAGSTSCADFRGNGKVLLPWFSLKILYPVKINPTAPSMIPEYFITELIFKTLVNARKKFFREFTGTELFNF